MVVPKLSSLLDYFPNLDQISVADLAAWSGEKYDPKLLENELGNRLLYPQIIPATEKDLKFDLAILHVALKNNISSLYKQPAQGAFNSKIIIPASFRERFPDLLSLIWVYMETINPEGIISVYMQSDIGMKNLGTVIRPEILETQGQALIEVNQDGASSQKQKFQVKVGSILVIPAPNTHVDVFFNCPSARIGNQKELTAHVIGGELGVVVDLRKARTP